MRVDRLVLMVVSTALVLTSCAGITSTASSDSDAEIVASEAPAGEDATNESATGESVDGEAGSEASAAEDPAGPQSPDIGSEVATAQAELAALDELLPSNSLPESEITVDFNSEQADFRAAGESFVEVIATSEDGSYLIGKVDEAAVARIGLTCAEDAPGDLLVSDMKGRSDQEWVPIIDQLVPSFVEASGCKAALLGSPTDCLNLPDDPAACIPGDGEGR